MKTKWVVLLFLMAFASCKTSQKGCPGASYQGPKFKASKFKWY
jgi:hypothetical protein